MALRAHWKGYLKLSLISAPVSVYGTFIFARTPLAEGGREPHPGGELVYAGDATGRTWFPIRYMRTIEMDGFLPIDYVDYVSYGTSYLIVPRDQVGQEAFATIRDGMSNARHLGVVRIDDKRTMVLEPYGKAILGTVLVSPNEARRVRSQALGPVPYELFNDIPDIQVPNEMLALMGHIIQAKSEAFAQPNLRTPPSVEALPAQIDDALTFTSPTQGPIGLLDDAHQQPDPEQVELYERLGRQLQGILQDVPTQELGNLKFHIRDFLDQPQPWQEVRFKKILWICGNSLRNVLAQHDAVRNDRDPHYARLPPAVAEALRRPVETWNVLVLGDIILRKLDSQRLGPMEQGRVVSELDVVTPIVGTAAHNRQITTVEAGTALEASLAAAIKSAENIHTQQAQVLARGTSQNFIGQVIRGAYRSAYELQNPSSQEALTFAKEYKAGIAKELAGLTIKGSAGAAAATGVAAYHWGVPFFEFVVSNHHLIQAYVATAFQNPELVRIISWIASVRVQLVSEVADSDRRR